MSVYHSPAASPTKPARIRLVTAAMMKSSKCDMMHLLCYTAPVSRDGLSESQARQHYKAASEEMQGGGYKDRHQNSRD